MRKIEVQSMADYFGKSLPAGKIQNRESRIAIVMLYSSLAKVSKDIDGEIESIKESLTKGHEEDTNKYAELLRKSVNKDVSEDERKKAKEEAEGMTECIQIEKDFAEATEKLLNENVDVELKKIPLDLLFDALTDCGFPKLTQTLSISAVSEIFKNIIA